MPTYFIIITHPGTHKEGFEWRKEKITKKGTQKSAQKKKYTKSAIFSLSLHIHRSSSVNGKLGFTDFEGQVCKIETVWTFLMIQNIGNASFSIVTGHWSTKWICLTLLWDCENVFNIWLKIEIWYFGMLLAVVVAFKGFWGIFITMRAQGRHIHYTYILANWRNYFKTFGKTLNVFLFRKG